MTDFRRFLIIVCAVCLAGTTCPAAEQPAVDKSAATEQPAEEQPGSILGAGQPSMAAQFKQITIVNIDEGVFEQGRLSQLEGNIKMVLIPREPEGVPVTLQADKARCIYAAEEDTMPDKVIAEGNVIIVQGENRFATDNAVWFRNEGKVVCEGNVKITYDKSVIFVKRLDHYLADERTVVREASGIIIPREPVEETPEEGTAEPVEDAKP